MSGAPIRGRLTFTAKCDICGEEKTEVHGLGRGDVVPLCTAGMRFFESLGNVCAKHSVAFVVDAALIREPGGQP